MHPPQEPGLQIPKPPIGDYLMRGKLASRSFQAPCLFLFLEGYSFWVDRAALLLFVNRGCCCRRKRSNPPKQSRAQPPSTQSRKGDTTKLQQDPLHPPKNKQGEQTTKYLGPPFVPQLQQQGQTLPPQRRVGCVTGGIVVETKSGGLTAGDLAAEEAPDAPGSSFVMGQKSPNCLFAAKMVQTQKAFKSIICGFLESPEARELPTHRTDLRGNF